MERDRGRNTRFGDIGGLVQVVRRTFRTLDIAWDRGDGKGWFAVRNSLSVAGRAFRSASITCRLAGLAAERRVNDASLTQPVVRNYTWSPAQRANPVTQIEHISDTAKWVAVYRAMETKRPDAIFRDPFAERLAGEKGQAIVDGMKSGRAMAWAMIVRTAVFDEVILERVRNGNADVVLNLAAGLDARPWRMRLPTTLRWIDVDHAGILDHKTDVMKNEKPVCQYESIRLDLADVPRRQALFSQIDAESSRVLVVSEGLVIYLKPEDVASLARDLHGARHFQWWLFDLASPRLLALMQKMWGRSVREGNAPFQFGPAESTDFFRPFGWEEREYHPAMDDAQRLHRQMKFMWFWRFLGRLRSRQTQEEFRRFSGTVLLERM